MTVIGGQEAGEEGPWRVNIISRMLEASSPWREIQLTDRASTGTNNRQTMCEKIFSTCSRDLAEWSERLTINAVVATVLGSIPVSSDKVESEGRQMKLC